MVTTSKQERVYRIVRKRIVDGTLRPGSRLVADALARELDVSPVPVREALRRLEAEGFVDYELNIGARVRTLDEYSWSQTLEAIAALDGFVTRLALPHIRPEDLRRAREANERMRQAAREAGPEQLKGANQEVHAALTGRCPNSYLRDLLASSWTRLYMSQQGSVFIYHPQTAQQQVDDHERIICLIEQGGDPDVLERIVREHTLCLVTLMRANGGSDSI
ncbi:MAG: GntR family transcriptional regulator [Actinomycetales bacterium]